MPTPKPLIAVTTAQVAASFGITREAVDQWRELIEPSPESVWWWASKAGQGRILWHLPRTIEWRARRAVELATRAAPAKELDPLQEEQLRKIKRENDEREGKLVNKAELVKQWSRVGADMRQELESVGRRHGVAVANDIARALAKLQRGVHGVMGDKP